MTRPLFVVCCALAFSSAAADAPGVVPTECATQLTSKHPTWKPYRPEEAYARKYPAQAAPIPPITADFDSDGKPDIAMLIMVQGFPLRNQKPRKGVAVVSCLSSRGGGLADVSRFVIGDSFFELKVIDNTRQNGLGIQSRLNLPPEKGILWGFHSGAYDYWYENGSFIEGDMDSVSEDE